MIVNHGNAFDQAVYEYGLVKGISFALRNFNANEVKKFLGDKLSEFLELITEELAEETITDSSAMASYSRAEHAWDELRGGIYSGLRSIMDPENHLKALYESAKSAEGIMD